MFGDWYRSLFAQVCQGLHYWCPNENWREPPLTRPGPAPTPEKPWLPGPQSYGSHHWPYGKYGIMFNKEETESDPLPNVPALSCPYPTLDPSGPAAPEPQGPPVRFTSRLEPIPRNPLRTRRHLITDDERLRRAGIDIPIEILKPIRKELHQNGDARPSAHSAAGGLSEGVTRETVHGREKNRYIDHTSGYKYQLVVPESLQ
ncbi:hypothetical protein B0T20DRAFT_396008 [Sordaria brevicollis]|uniref:Uncharacterized protein n=1 Tax=Sordaria brevicollis TaxID=83679 RepID=A0AAE0P387_SORBR|nr:hypothetical protein B0T20DRAFT_396008 [Sordaria brevicollis]